MLTLLLFFAIWLTKNKGSAQKNWASRAPKVRNMCRRNKQFVFCIWNWWIEIIFHSILMLFLQSVFLFFVYRYINWKTIFKWMYGSNTKIKANFVGVSSWLTLCKNKKLTINLLINWKHIFRSDFSLPLKAQLFSTFHASCFCGHLLILVWLSRPLSSLFFFLRTHSHINAQAVWLLFFCFFLLFFI